MDVSGRLVSLFKTIPYDGCFTTTPVVVKPLCGIGNAVSGLFLNTCPDTVCEDTFDTAGVFVVYAVADFGFTTRSAPIFGFGRNNG